MSILGKINSKLFEVFVECSETPTEYQLCQEDYAAFLKEIGEGGGWLSVSETKICFGGYLTVSSSRLLIHNSIHIKYRGGHSRIEFFDAVIPEAVSIDWLGAP